MGYFTKSTDKCLEVLQGFHAAREKLDIEYASTRIELAKLRAADVEGDAALDGFLGGVPSGGLTQQFELTDQGLRLDGARRALLRRIRASILELGAARADAIRKSIPKLQKELDAHMTERQRLLDALQSYTREKYWPQERPFGDSGYDAKGREISFSPTETLPTPIWAELQNKIGVIEAEAKQAEQLATQAVNGGSFRAVSTAELLKLGDDIERIAPLRSTIERWLETAVPRAQADFAARFDDNDRMFGRVPDTQTLEYVLVWTAEGDVDAQNSKVLVTGQYSPQAQVGVA